MCEDRAAKGTGMGRASLLDGVVREGSGTYLRAPGWSNQRKMGKQVPAGGPQGKCPRWDTLEVGQVGQEMML
jgi:hypothetical protein